MSQTDTEQRLGAGTVVDGRYEIDRLLGSGGFANVYLARHSMLGTNVALKVLHAPLAASSDPQFAQRFRREAKVAAQMRHPNVVNVTDFGFLDSGDPYIVMEHLEGRDLEEELRSEGTITPSRLLKLMVPCVQAIGEAHRASVVHKDLKPSNLFLVDAGTPTERLVVLDFGVARVFDDADANITQTGAFTGTPAYLPPEYIREQRVTPAFDVYQMGLILIECLTGQQAIEADGPMGFLLAHCMGRLTVEPDFFDNELGRVIQKAISIEDVDRFDNCAEMAEALARVTPPADASFDGRRFTRETSPISSQDVAAFADTLSSGQIVGDSFVTGGGSQVDQSAQNRAFVPQEATVSNLPAAGQSQGNKGLIAIAIAAVILVIGAVGAVFVIGSQQGDSDQGSDENGAVVDNSTTTVEPVAINATTESDDTAVAADESVGDEVFALAQSSVGSGVAVARADAAGAFADAEEKARLEDARKSATKRRAERRRRVKEVAKKAERERKSEKATKEEPAKKPKKRLLVVD